MIQDQIKRAMSAEADQLRPATNLAETVIARGRRARRTRRIGLGVAIVSGIVAAAVLPGAIIQSTRPEPAEVTPTPAPAPRDVKVRFYSLPEGAAPRLPYTFGSTNTGGFLDDGDTRVPIVPGVRFDVVSRVDGGWLVSRSDAKSQDRLGIKRPNGTFTPLGASFSGYVAVSRDGRHVAFPAGEREIVVVDVRTGARTASAPIPSGTIDVLGWNADGIWFHRTGDPQWWVWQPGSVPRLMPEAHVTNVVPGSNRMVRIPAPPGPRCAEVVTLGSDNRLDVVRRFCLNGGDIDGARLSPDGRRILLPDGSVHPVDGGKAVKIRGPMALIRGLEGVWWEDSTNVLVIETGVDPFNQRLVRCDVRTGKCERAFDQKADPNRGYFSVATR